MTVRRIALGELFRIGSSKRVLQSQWTSGGVPFYRGREVTRLSIDGKVDNELFISEDLFKEFSEKYGVPNPDDIMITAIGTIGNSYIVRASDRFYFKDASVLWLKKLIPVSSKFINYWLKSPLFFGQLDRGNGTTVDTLTIQKLQRVVVDLPSPREQQRIVAILDEAFEGIATAKANAEKNLHYAREVLKSHLQSALTQKREGWTETLLGDIATFSSGGTPSKQNASFWDGPIPWVSGRDMKSDRIGDTVLHISRASVEASATRIAPIGSLLILVRGMGLANGVAIAELVAPCAFNQDIKAIRANPGVDPRFLLFSLRTKLSDSDQILSNAAHGTLKIDMEVLQSITLLIPSLEIQKKAIKQIDEIQEEAQHLESIYQGKLSSLDELKQSLLHRAFNGDL